MPSRDGTGPTGNGPVWGGGMGRGLGAGRGLGGGPYAAGPGGNCVCPACGYKLQHATGTPCTNVACPKCRSRMVRAA